MAAIIRIILRYGTGILITKGLITPDEGIMISGNVELIAGIQTGIEALVAAAVGLGTEIWYYLARKYDWAK